MAFHPGTPFFCLYFSGKSALRGLTLFCYGFILVNKSVNKEKTMVGCVQLDGFDAGKQFVFMIECLLDPEKPDDIYFGEIIRKD